MNALIENNFISEIICGSNFAYVLSDNNAFLPTEYKVLQSQMNSCFVRCMKMTYNGKIQLYYLTKGLKSFASMIPILDADSFLTIIVNLFTDIVDVMHNGFLSCQNIDISFERIYVDPATYKVSLIYLPIGQRLFDESAAFENELRTSLVKLISNILNLASPKTRRFSVDLSNGSLSFEDLLRRIKDKRGDDTIRDAQVNTNENSVTYRLKITAMNAPTRVELEMTKDEFVIGKKKELVDGVISFNKMISRSHCKINRRGNLYTITDLQSANGTYVNKLRLQPNQPCQINNGDIVRLADSDFQVTIVEG